MGVGGAVGGAVDGAVDEPVAPHLLPLVLVQALDLVALQDDEFMTMNRLTTVFFF